MGSDHESVLAVWEKLDQWADRSGVPETKRLVLDLGDLYSASSKIVRAVDELVLTAGLDPKEQGRLLLRIQTWLYEELLDHATSMRQPLQMTIREIFKAAEDST
jgi:hypothetical protein